MFVQTQSRRVLVFVSYLCLCALKKKSTVVIQERILSIPAGGTTDLPLGSTVNDLLLFTNELNTEQVGPHV